MTDTISLCTVDVRRVAEQDRYLVKLVPTYADEDDEHEIYVLTHADLLGLYEEIRQLLGKYR